MGFLCGLLASGMLWAAMAGFIVSGYGVPEALAGVLLVGPLVALVSSPFVVLFAVPCWLVLRLCGVRGWSIYALFGSALALAVYLCVGVPYSQPSGRPMSFMENLSRPMHIPRIAISMVAGGFGAIVFWEIAVNRGGWLRMIRVRIRWCREAILRRVERTP
jgi:hypothetical protein